jgi:hypothetical protein
MPHTLAIDETEGIITVSYTGECTLDELKAAVLEVTDSRDYRPSHHVLSDLRGCAIFLDPDRLPELARLFDERCADSTGKSALLLDTPHETALALLHQRNVAGARTTELFSTREAALAWLRSG